MVRMIHVPTEAVIFDLGGVLIDWNPRYLYQKLLQDDEAIEFFLATVCHQQWNEKQDAGRPFQVAIEERVTKYPEHKVLIESYFSRWDEMLGGAIQGTVRILETLRASGIPLFVISNWSAETFHHATNRFSFFNSFQDMVISGEVGLTKPDPRIFSLALKRFQLRAERALFIDDMPHNVRAAEACGLQALHFRDSDELACQLQSRGILAKDKTTKGTQ